MPIVRASSSAASSSPSARLALVPVTATAASPSAIAAALATTALSTPPEKATAQLPTSRSFFSTASRFSSNWAIVLSYGFLDLLGRPFGGLADFSRGGQLADNAGKLWGCHQ